MNATDWLPSGDSALEIMATILIALIVIAGIVEIVRLLLRDEGA